MPLTVVIDDHYLPEPPIVLFWHLARLIGPLQALLVTPMDGFYTETGRPFVILILPSARLSPAKMA